MDPTIKSKSSELTQLKSEINSRSDAMVKVEQLERGRSCSKLKTRCQNRHRSVSLSPPLTRNSFRRSVHRKTASFPRRRSVSPSPHGDRKCLKCNACNSDSAIGRNTKDGWTEVPELVLTGFGFPKLA